MSNDWPTDLPVYRCPANCGCVHLLVEVDPLDVLREPRINDVVPIRGRKHNLPVLDCTWLLAGHQACPFLESDKRCGIYATRPNVCVAFAAGSEKCQELRKDHGMPELIPTVADGSMLDRLTAEMLTAEFED